MADQWYYTDQGQQMGPVSTEELKRYAASGRLQPGDLVWKDGMPKWVPVSSVGEFAVRQAAVAEPIPFETPDRRRDREPADRYFDDDRPRRRPRRQAATGMST